MSQSTRTDSYGLALSTGSDLAAEHYRDGVALMLSAWPGAADLFEATLREDPGFALAHAALARLDAFAARPADAVRRITIAGQLAAEGASERERSHVEVFRRALTGKSQDALTLALDHADQWPRDVIILGMPLGAFGLFAFSGMAGHDQARVDLCQRHEHHFAADDWWFLTNQGWSLVENGDVSRGRGMLERAHDIRAHNANGVHALLHALYEAGAHEDAEALISAWLPGYDRSGLLHGHISWHAALSALDRGDAQSAMAVYLGSVQPSVSQGAPINVVTDGASLLWRLDAYGHQAGDEHWRDLAAYAHRAFPRPGHGFTDAHMGLIDAALGQAAAVEQRCSALEAMIAEDAYPTGTVVPGLCRAALAFRAQDFAGCVSILSPLLQSVVRIGGSGAQRDIVEETLLVALMSGGETDRAKQLLDQRLHRRPSSRDMNARRILPTATQGSPYTPLS